MSFVPHTTVSPQVRSSIKIFRVGFDARCSDGSHTPSISPPRPRALSSLPFSTRAAIPQFGNGVEANSPLHLAAASRRR